VDACDDLPALPAAVEVAAYRIVVEAVTNTVRHARARHCRVSIRCTPGGLAVEVADDGTGLNPAGSHGHGLAIMRERAAELGGTVTIKDGVPGVTVQVRLPAVTAVARVPAVPAVPA
jgi:two-component system, NarL family, sensor kinase